MRLLQCLVLSVVVSLLGGCSGQLSVKLRQPAADNLTALKTFAWKNPALTLAGQSSERAVTFDSTFRRKVSKALEDKGYSATSSQSEMLVDYKLTAIPSGTADPTGSDNSWMSGTDGHLSFQGWNEPGGVDQFRERGIVLLTVYDTDNKILWEASASRIVRYSESFDEVEKLMDRVVRRMMRHFPAR